MNKKKIRILAPLGFLLLSLVVLVGCRPSTALTRLMNAMNALNPGMEETRTEEEQEEDKASRDMDPLDEERDDAEIEEMDILIGQLLENMDEEEAQEALQSLYSDMEETHEWGAQQYDPDRLNDDSDTGALALYIRDHDIRLESNRTDGTGTVINGMGTEGTEGVQNSSGTLQSSKVPLTMDEDAEATDGGSGGADDDEKNKTGINDSADDPIDQGTIPTEEEPGSSGSSNTPATDPVETPSAEPTPEPTESEPEPSTSVEPGSYYGHTIAAAGQAAVMVCMLGGSDRLVATSPDFQNEMTQRAFNKDGQMNYDVLWTGLDTDDGSEPMSETEFKYLMEVVQPELCIEISGQNTFTEDQISRIRYTYGFSYYSIDSLTSQKNIENSLYWLAWDMDQSESGEPAMAIYEKYVDWVDRNVTTSLAKSTMIAQQTVFIEDWDDDVETRYTSATNGSTTTITTGAAIIKIGYSFRPLRDYLVNAQVYDWAAAPSCPTKSGYDFNSNFAKGVNTGVSMYIEPYTWSESDVGLITQPGDLCYVSPIYPWNLRASTGQAISPLRFANCRTGVGCINNDYIGTSKYSPWETGGDLSFGLIFAGYQSDTYHWDYVIARTQTIADKLQNHYTWQPGSTTYVEEKHWGEIGGNAEGMDIYGRKFTQTQFGQNLTYYTTIQGNYEVIVNPAGCLGSWVDGSVESVLESIWASSEINGYVGKNTEKSLILGFYSTFYGLDLTDEEYDQLMAGPVE